AVERAARDQPDRSEVFQRSDQAGCRSDWHLWHHWPGRRDQRQWRESIYSFELAGAAARRSTLRAGRTRSVAGDPTANFLYRFAGRLWTINPKPAGESLWKL